MAELVIPSVEGLAGAHCFVTGAADFIGRSLVGGPVKIGIDVLAYTEDRTQD